MYSSVSITPPPYPLSFSKYIFSLNVLLLSLTSFYHKINLSISIYRYNLNIGILIFVNPENFICKCLTYYIYFRKI